MNLDVDLLRTFVLGIELGSFARAAQRVGRSQSAISTQLRRLEEQVGQPLVRKVGRSLVTTEAGETLLSYARRILDLNDEALATLAMATKEECVRLGLPQDFAETWLPDIIQRFTRTHPQVRIEVQSEKVRALVEKTIRGELDLSLAWGHPADAPHVVHVADVPIKWVGSPDWPGRRSFDSDIVPLIAFDPPCAFREPATAAMDRAGIAWRIAFSSPSLAGLWGATSAGIGIMARTHVGLPATLRALEPASIGMPELPAAPLTLVRASATQHPFVETLSNLLLEVAGEQLLLG